jgi:hypothetical protein
MNYLKIILLCLFIYSCSSNEPTSETSDGPFTINGRILAPNGSDPIASSKITLQQLNGDIKIGYSDAKGVFSIENIDYGVYEVLLTKGLFSSQRSMEISNTTSDFDFDLGDIILNGIPNIGVVKGSYDNIETILYDIGLVNPITGAPLFDIIDGGNFERLSQDHGHHSNTTNRMTYNPQLDPNVDFDFTDLLSDPAQLASYDILFLNCGLDTSDAETSTAIYDYVNNGGILYATDWTFPFIESINTLSGTDFITYQQPYKNGDSTSTEATILSSELNDWLDLNFDLTIDNTVVIDEFLPSWQVVETYDASNTIPWLNGPVTYSDDSGSVTEDKDLAFTFLVGDGGVFYSSFHSENHEVGFTCVDRVMEYLVFELATLVE